MPDSELRIRRARRTDFTAVMQLLAAAGLPLPSADRATLRRFRNIVIDLGADFYLAFRDEGLLGLVYATYTRRLSLPSLARIEQLVVVGDLSSATVATALVEFVAQRAARRGCSELQALDGAIAGVPAASLLDAGLQATTQQLLQLVLTPSRDREAD